MLTLVGKPSIITAAGNKPAVPDLKGLNTLPSVCQRSRPISSIGMSSVDLKGLLLNLSGLHQAVLNT